MRAVVLAVLAVASIAAAVAAGPAADPDVPKYHRGMWLMDSLAIVDVIVAGTPRAPAAEGDKQQAVKKLAIGKLEVAKTLFGTLHADLMQGEGAVKLLPYRCAWNQQGLWLLLRTPQGYAVLNPEPEPLPAGEWRNLAKMLEGRARPRADVKERAATHQLYRYYADKKTGADVWHGVNVWVGLSSVYTEVFEDGRRTHIRGWDDQGRLEIVHRPGLTLRFLRGHVWQFNRWAGERKTGVSRAYFQQNLEQAYTEAHWQDGVRHGPAREWDTNGKLVSEVIYENGFVPPVVRYRGKEPSRAKLLQTEDDNGYEADRALMDALKVGMTTADASRLLKLDFSETDGIYFPRYEGRTSLHIAFEDGRIAARRIDMRPSFETKKK